MGEKATDVAREYFSRAPDIPKATKAIGQNNLTNGLNFSNLQ
jgi:hypothetical protein